MVLICWTKRERKKGNVVLHLLIWIYDSPFSFTIGKCSSWKNLRGMGCVILNWLYMHFIYMNSCATIQASYLLDKEVSAFTSHQCYFKICVDSYDDRAATQKILQKLKLENFQVCFSWTMCVAVVPEQTWNVIASNKYMMIIFMVFYILFSWVGLKCFSGLVKLAF